MKRFLVLVALTAVSIFPATAFADESSAVHLVRLQPHAINPVLALGESATYAITVTNVSDANLVLGAEVFGNNLGVTWTFPEDCGDGRLIAPGQTCSYTMTFAPIVAGRIEGTFCVTGITEARTEGDRECGTIRGVAH
jgi:hypothetical protein